MSQVLAQPSRRTVSYPVFFATTAVTLLALSDLPNPYVCESNHVSCHFIIIIIITSTPNMLWANMKTPRTRRSPVGMVGESVSVDMCWCYHGLERIGAHGGIRLVPVSAL